MIHQVFTVYDAKAEIYLPPFYAQTKGHAVRMFEDSANDPEHQFNRHAEDFTLFHCGTYEDTTSEFSIFAAPMALGVAIEFRKGQLIEVPAQEEKQHA